LSKNLTDASKQLKQLKYVTVPADSTAGERHLAEGVTLKSRCTVKAE
jgi:hypothetical protein